MTALLLAMAELDPDKKGKTAGEWAQLADPEHKDLREVFESVFREITPRCIGNTLKRTGDALSVAYIWTSPVSQGLARSYGAFLEQTSSNRAVRRFLSEGLQTLQTQQTLQQ